MGGGTNISQVRTNGAMPLGRALSLALDNFGEEQGYGADPDPGRPYEYTQKLYSPDEAYSILEALRITDEKSPVIATTSDYDEVTEKVVRKVTKREYEYIRRYASMGVTRGYDSFFANSGYVSTIVKAEDLPDAQPPHVVITPGDFEDVYVIMDDYKKVVSEHSTLEEASTEATRILNLPKNTNFSRLEIEIVRKRVNGTSVAAVVERNVGDEVEVTFTATKHVVKPDSKINGYVIGYSFRN